MLIRWIETNDVGEEIVREHERITIRNVHTYARKNHTPCEGRGYNNWDDGFYYDAAGERVPINPRAILCDCALKTLAKVGI